MVVCDGFVGNVALKTSEGLTKLVRDMLKQSLNTTVTAQVGALLSRKAFNAFKKRLDPSEYGGAPLLGVRGVCIIGHGSSNERAIYNGIRVAAEFAQAGINERIEREFAQRPARADLSEWGRATASVSGKDVSVQGNKPSTHPVSVTARRKCVLRRQRLAYALEAYLLR